MAKEFQYKGEGSATVYLAGQPNHVEPGDTVEATTEAEAESLAANSDFAPAKKGGSKGGSGKKE